MYEKTIVVGSEPILYPNPVQDMLFINIGLTNLTRIPVEIYDLTGKLIVSKTYSPTSNTLSIDVSNIESGFFILKITTSEKTHNYKIIKQ